MFTIFTSVVKRLSKIIMSSRNCENWKKEFHILYYYSIIQYFLNFSSTFLSCTFIIIVTSFIISYHQEVRKLTRVSHYRFIYMLFHMPWCNNRVFILNFIQLIKFVTTTSSSILSSFIYNIIKSFITTYYYQSVWVLFLPLTRTVVVVNKHGSRWRRSFLEDTWGRSF